MSVWKSRSGDFGGLGNGIRGAGNLDLKIWGLGSPYMRIWKSRTLGLGGLGDGICGSGSLDLESLGVSRTVSEGLDVLILEVWGAWKVVIVGVDA